MNSTTLLRLAVTAALTAGATSMASPVVVAATPVVATAGHYAIIDGSAAGTSVGFAVGVDDDGDAISYSLAEPSAQFAVDESTGELTLVAPIDRADGVSRGVAIAMTDGVSVDVAEQTVLVVPGDHAEMTGVDVARWTGIGGGSVVSLIEHDGFPDDPDEEFAWPGLAMDTTGVRNHGQRFAGYLQVHETDDYRLSVSSNDGSEVRISTDASPANLGEVVASVTERVDEGEWDRYPSQTSDPISLVAGRLYYLEVLYKQDYWLQSHVEVALRADGDTTSLDDLVLGADMLRPVGYVDVHAPTAPPQLSIDLVTEATVRLGWRTAADDQEVAGYRVRRDGGIPVDLPADARTHVDVTVEPNTVYSYDLTAVDAFGNESMATPITVDTSNAIDAVESALLSGDARHVSDPLLLVDAALDEQAALHQTGAEIRHEFYGLDADGNATADSITSLDWDPTHDAALFTSLRSTTHTVLRTNAVRDDAYYLRREDLGIAGVQPNGDDPSARFLALGSNPMRHTSLTADSSMNQFMLNAVAWLTDRDDLDVAPMDVVLAQLDESTYFRDQTRTRAWLDREFAGRASYNDAAACNGVALATCIDAGPDLVVISQAHGGSDVAAIRDAVADALAAGIPVLYVHHDGGLEPLGDALLAEMDIGYHADNRWRQLEIAGFDVTAAGLGAGADDAITTMLMHFSDGDYTFDWTMCDGTTSCPSVPGLVDEFEKGAAAVRGLFTQLDAAGIDLWDSADHRMEKLLALIGDAFRQQAAFPMSRGATPDDELMRSLYADHAAYHSRDVNPAQPDMGNFSRSDFSHITPSTVHVDTTSKRHFRATGAYALPGQTVTVTRTDASDVGVTVFVNTVRSTAIHQYRVDRYNRPKFVSSAKMAVEPGQTIRFTSPYGGPIQLGFDTNDLAVSVSIDNVGEHAFWNGDDDDAEFVDRLSAGDFDWAEMATPNFEIHSQLDKMRASIANDTWGTPSTLAAGTETYLHGDAHALAGFQGPGIDVIDEVVDFADRTGWSISHLDIVKHMNADQPTCGSGCSGNPYDASWSFDPIAHGDLHELGHGLQGGRTFSGWENHSMTNFYSFYAKSNFVRETGQVSNGCSGDFEAVYDIVQASLDAPHPVAYLQNELWDDAGYYRQYTMYAQMMMAAQASGAVDDGWHLRTFLHLADREFNTADNNDEQWAARRDALGFGSYTRAQARAIDSDDWMLVAVSNVTERDFTEYLTMWGFTFGQQALDQVASFGFPSIERNYHVSSSGGYCRPGENGDYLDKVAIPVDARRPWPLDIDRDGDGYWDQLDNCPAITNADQSNRDGDAMGDVCDSSPDGDTGANPTSTTTTTTVPVTTTVAPPTTTNTTTTSTVPVQRGPVIDDPADCDGGCLMPAVRES